MPGELPPPPPGAIFGRDELIEEIVHHAEDLTPIALIGAGGIGKSSIALAALHDDRIKQRFGENRRFIRCDEILATNDQFLRRLSMAIGAGVENPENLTPLQQSLSLEEMLIVLDNAEFLLDPQGPSAREIHASVNELAQYGNICLLITSRISTIPPVCETFEIPTLSMEAASDTFHRICKHDGRSNSIEGVLKQLDFVPLSITLLATFSQQNRWDTDRLVTEWTSQRTAALVSLHNGSLAATIELSLGLPTFQELGPDAREFLGVVSFFPQGVNEESVHWQCPTISNAQKMIDEFCILSLAHRNNGFVTMLPPLRDHLRPRDPRSSRLLNSIREIYFTRLSGDIRPGDPGFEEARWITSEDVNVEHLLDVFTTIDPGSEMVWNACVRFMAQLYWHKPRPVTLGPKIEALPDDHPSKAQGLLELSRLSDSVGNVAEQKRLLNYALELWRGQGNDFRAARTLVGLSDTNRRMGLYQEGIEQGREASNIFERLGDPVRQATCLTSLASLLQDDKQLDAAEEVALHAIDLLPEEGEEIQVYKCHRVLGAIYQSKGEMEKVVLHLEAALGIASALNSAEELFQAHSDLAGIFIHEGRFNNAQAHLEHAKSFVADNTHFLARASFLQARLWYVQDMFGEARIEALIAFDTFAKLGIVEYVESTRRLLQQIDARWP